MYFNIPLIVFATILSYVANLVLIIYMPGPGLENLEIGTFIGQPSTLILALDVLLLQSCKVKKLLDLILRSEEDANKMRNDISTIFDNSQKAAGEAFSVSEALSESTESISASVEEIASTPMSLP